MPVRLTCRRCGARTTHYEFPIKRFPCEVCGYAQPQKIEVNPPSYALVEFVILGIAMFTLFYGIYLISGVL